MTKTLDFAVNKAQQLPEAAQEEIGRELLTRVLEIEEMRKAVALGVEQLDRGEVTEFDMQELLAELHREHGNK